MNLTGPFEAETRPKITEHQLGALNSGIDIVVDDLPGPGGAPTRYSIAIRNDGPGTDKDVQTLTLQFQDGSVKDKGRNGLSIEALLAICLHRMRGFQNGRFSSRDNALAITHLEDCLSRLQKRTRERQLRGVEGELVP